MRKNVRWRVRYLFHLGSRFEIGVGLESEEL
mgnify:CR=1 FL=1